MSQFFITSSGTGVGKTFVTAALTHQLKADGKNVRALKPIISGFDPADETTDVHQLLAAQGLEFNEENLKKVVTYIYKQPLAPDMASRIEDSEEVELEVVNKLCEPVLDGEITLIEGVGGVMAPLNFDESVLDWVKSLNIPVILVVGSYLGAISHALTANEVLLANNIEVRSVVISESEDKEVPSHETYSSLTHFIAPERLHFLKRVVSSNKGFEWKDAPSLVHILEK